MLLQIMQDMKRRKVLITGASRGVGLHLALKLSEDPLNDLILVARDNTALQDLKNRIKNSAQILALDLTTEEDLQKLMQSAPQVDILINNAGIGSFGRFTEQNPNELIKMIRLNCEAPVRLANFYAPKMIQGLGVIVNVSSLAGIFSIPYFSVYSATKAFLVSLGEGLTFEFKDQNLQIITVCPAGIKTEFHLHAGLPPEIIKSFDRTLLTPQQVALAIVGALFQNSSLVVPGFTNRLFLWISKLISKKFMVEILGSIYKKYVKKYSRD